MSQAYGRIAIHFFRAPQCLSQAIIILSGKNARQRIEQTGGKLRPVGFGEAERQSFDFSESDHGGKFAGNRFPIKTQPRRGRPKGNHSNPCSFANAAAACLSASVFFGRLK